jgi:hypothetical protein
MTSSMMEKKSEETKEKGIVRHTTNLRVSLPYSTPP